MSIAGYIIKFIQGMYALMIFIEIPEIATQNILWINSLLESWSIYAKSYLIAYVVLKYFFYFFRILGIYASMKLKKTYGALTITANFIFWFWTIYAYYITQANEFFKEENDWRSKAKNLYYGMLYVFIEDEWLLSF